MDKRTLLAAACGITGEHLSRWTEVDKQAHKIEGDDVFYIDGPITPSGGGLFGGSDENVATPETVRSFFAGRKGKDVELCINSPGGSVFDGYAMLGECLKHDGGITVRVAGACFSAATYFLTIPNAHRILMPGSMVMIHNVQTFAMGDSVRLQKVIDRLVKMNESYADRISEHTNYDKDEVLAMMNEETWFDAQEAVDGGFADELFVKEDEEEESEDDKEDEDVKQAVDIAGLAVRHRLSRIL